MDSRRRLPETSILEVTEVSDARFAADRNLSFRMLSVMFLLLALYAGALGLLVVLLGPWWPVGVAAVVAFGYFQIRTSGRLAMGMVGARVVTAAQEPDLHAVVDRLCALAGMDKPQVAVVESPVPNAFAVGRSKRATALCVSRGMLNELEPTELEGVVAHELSHIAHGDAAVMTVASFLGVLAGLAARLGVRLMMFRNHILLAGIGVILVSTATWFASLVLTRSLSRYREFAADQSAAQLTGNPSALSSALAKVSQSVGTGGGIPRTDLRKASALNAFYFCPVTATKSGARHLLSTHPTTAARMERLERMSARLGK